MSDKVGETICDDNEQGSPVSASQRYFKAQTTFQGNCLVCSINNALGEPVLCVNSLRQRVKAQREPSKRVPLLHRQNKLFSFHLAVEALNVSNIRVVKLSGFRTPREKFEFLLNVTEGRYIAMTNLNDDTQRRGSHDTECSTLDSGLGRRTIGHRQFGSTTRSTKARRIHLDTICSEGNCSSVPRCSVRKALSTKRSKSGCLAFSQDWSIRFCLTQSGDQAHMEFRKMFGSSTRGVQRHWKAAKLR